MVTRHLEEQESKYIVRTPYAFEIANQKIIQGTKKGERSKPHNESTEKKKRSVDSPSERDFGTGIG